MSRIPEEHLQISLQELALRGRKILERQGEMTYDQALAQVRWLRENSKIKAADKKGRKRR